MNACRPGGRPLAVGLPGFRLPWFSFPGFRLTGFRLTGFSLLAFSLLGFGLVCTAAAADGLTAEQAFVACDGCHSIEAGAPHGVGPNLHGIAGRPAASLPDYPYSPALRKSKLVWDRGTLTGWVLMAEHMVPGTWMLYYNELEPDDVHRLVDWLLQQRSAD